MGFIGSGKEYRYWRFSIKNILWDSMRQYLFWGLSKIWSSPSVSECWLFRIEWTLYIRFYKTIGHHKSNNSLQDLISSYPFKSNPYIMQDWHATEILRNLLVSFGVFVNIFYLFGNDNFDFKSISVLHSCLSLDCWPVLYPPQFDLQISVNL